MLSELNCLYNIFYDVNYIVDFSNLYLCKNKCLINLDLKQSIIYLLIFWDLSVCIHCILFLYPCVSFRWCNVIQVFFAYVAFPPSFVFLWYCLLFLIWYCLLFWWKINLNLKYSSAIILVLRYKRSKFLKFYNCWKQSSVKFIFGGNSRMQDRIN